MIQPSGDISSSVEVSQCGKEMLGPEARGDNGTRERQGRVDKIANGFISLLSGSQTMFPSSSYDANRFMSDEAATINEVEASNTMLEYGRERGTEREGRWASNWTSGIHSTRLGPWACHTISLCVAIRNTPNAHATHCSSNNRHVPLQSTAGSLPSTPTASMS